MTVGAAVTWVVVMKLAGCDSLLLTVTLFASIVPLGRGEWTRTRTTKLYDSFGLSVPTTQTLFPWVGGGFAERKVTRLS